MLDPFPAPPRALVKLVTPLAELLSLPTLPLHAHEILFAALSYQAIASFVSPAVSSRLFPRTYRALPYRTRVNWDVHVVSLVQSVLVNGLALWVIAMDDERRAMDWPARVWGYTGASGLVQGLAAGYFLWDLAITVRHVDIFGWGMLVHAICALCVFACGFVSDFPVWEWNGADAMRRSGHLSTTTAPYSSSTSCPLRFSTSTGSSTSLA